MMRLDERQFVDGYGTAAFGELAEHVGELTKTARIAFDEQCVARFEIAKEASDTAQRIAEIERKQKAIREKLDRLDEAFLYERMIDIDTYDRHRDKLRQEFMLAQMDRHSCELEEMDVEGILAFAERVLPSASNLWVQSSLAQKQRLQQVFFPEGVRFDGTKLVGTGATLPGFQLLEPSFRREKRIGGPDRDRAGKASRRRCRPA
jgi:hypothetical protein